MPILRVEKREVKLKRPFAEIPEVEFRKGLVLAPTFTWLPKPAIEGKTVLAEVQAQAPVDGREIVPWMQEAAAYNAAFEGMCEDYVRAGSMLVSLVGDGLIPSVGVGSGTHSAKFTSVNAETVGGQGGAYFTASGQRFFCPEGGKLTAITKDFLAWAAIPGVYAWQWIAALLAWLDLANSPISERIRFASCNGLTAPNFVVVGSTFPPPAMVMHLGFTSNRSQKVAIVGRSRGDYTKELFSDSLDIPAGESTMDYFILSGLPLDAFVLHLQPQDGSETILDSLSTTPP